MPRETKVDLTKILMLNANCTCGDCAHLFMADYGDEEGTCPEAAEALALEGWAKVTVHVAPEMSAESCPRFENREKTHGPGEEVDDAYQSKKEDES